MDTKKRNIWVLGGTGFIGSSLVRQLSTDPKNLIHMLVHKNIPARYLESFNIFTGDIRSFDLFWLERYPPDIIYHLARLGGTNTVTRSLAAHMGASANQRLINYLLGLSSPPRIVYVSGSLVYGHQKDGAAADEQSKLLPVSFARHYLIGEAPWIRIQDERRLDVRFARPGWIVGPDSWFKVFYWNHYKKTGKVPMYGEGKQLMSLVQLDDCAGQIAMLGEHGSTMQNMNIFSGEPVSQYTFARTLADLLHTNLDPIAIETLQNIYGRAIGEAFTSSIPLRTCVPETAGRYQNISPDVRTILQKTISLLKNEQ
ncbi:MAG: NAD(P)-dependent oxidoreductase [Bacteriovoracaceae bacterium]